jgi:hypothetical protein
MYQKKKARRARGLGSDPGLDLAIPRSSNSFALNIAKAFEKKVFNCFLHKPLRYLSLFLHP